MYIYKNVGSILNNKSQIVFFPKCQMGTLRDYFNGPVVCTRFKALNLVYPLLVTNEKDLFLTSCEKEFS